MMIRKVSRRDFLKFSLALSANSYFLLGKNSSKFSLLNKQDETAGNLGRVLFNGSEAHILPNADSQVADTYYFNQVIEYEGQVTVQSGHPRNEIWFKLADNSYIHSKYLQPVKNQLNEPVMDISTSGQLAEITVPYTTAVVNQWTNNQNTDQDQLFFYGSTHWVYGLGKDEEGNLYYLVKEDRWEDSFYVDATHLRLIEDWELNPTSTKIEQSEKRILINLEEQYLVAYENGEPVFMSALSSGQLAGSADLTTPTGSYIINYKRPSRHMVHSDRIGINDNELYGVPWVSYFTDTGIAFHGTYWHNDFSQPNSHGCINLPIPAARWIYLWSQPVVPPREKKYVSNKGTTVEVV
jgi:lipoprotein-anchoring transpeptidase ErfK/SrfK